jgi:hypothetical protein
MIATRCACFVSVTIKRADDFDPAISKTVVGAAAGSQDYSSPR